MGVPFTPEQAQQLEQRAARIARAPTVLNERTERLLTFRRGESCYALAAADLRGVRTLPRLTRLPCAAPHVLGVVNLGGHTLGVFDLERLERPNAPPPAVPWALWLAHEARGIVLVADELLDVVDVPESQLSTEVRGVFAGRLAALIRAVLPDPLLVLHTNLLLNPELYRPLER